MTDELRMDLHRRVVAGDLRMVQDARAPLDELPDMSDVDVIVALLKEEHLDWFVLFAASVHISYARSYLPNVIDRFQDAERSSLEQVVYATFSGYPDFDSNLNASPVALDLNPNRSSYFHSRCALAMLVENEEPERAIELLAPLRDFFPPRANVNHSRDISYQGRQIFWGLLKNLYARIEDFRSAIEMSLVGSMRFGNLDGYREFILFLEGLGRQVWQGPASVDDAIFLLDSSLAVIRQCRKADELERDDLSECGIDTIQYWAWNYGGHVAELVHHKPHLASTLLDQVQSAEWDDGWPAAALIFESSETRSWAEYRKKAIALYDAASVEYGGGYPYGTTPPPHFSPEGDVYWAARVGLADRMLALRGGETMPDLVSIHERIEAIQSIGTSHFQKSIRVEIEQNRRFDQIQNSFPRGPDDIRASLREALDDQWNQLPSAVVNYLVNSERLWDAGLNPDQMQIEMAKAVEALIYHLMLAPVAEHASRVGMAEPRLEFTSGGTNKRSYPPRNWHRLAFGQWAEVLERAADSVDEPYVTALIDLYPAFKNNLAKTIAEGIRKTGEYRAASAHHTESVGIDTALESAARMRALILGDKTNKSLLVEMIDCFGSSLNQ